MLFQKRFWPGIQTGDITLTFRRWKRPQVVADRVYRTAAGRLRVVDVRIVDPEQITDADAARSGHPSADALRLDLPGEEGDPVYRIAFGVVEGPDPREELANDADLSDEDVDEITTRLERLDRASRRGPWTHGVLRLIAEHPHRRAPDLAAMRGLETNVFKTDVRKLKNLGLTLSFNPGYDLSPRGREYLARLESA